MTTRTIWLARAGYAATALVAAALTFAAIAWVDRLQAEVEALQERVAAVEARLPAPLSGREGVTLCEELPVDPH